MKVQCQQTSHKSRLYTMLLVFHIPPFNYHYPHGVDRSLYDAVLKTAESVYVHVSLSPHYMYHPTHLLPSTKFAFESFNRCISPRGVDRSLYNAERACIQTSLHPASLHTTPPTTTPHPVPGVSYVYSPSITALHP